MGQGLLLRPVLNCIDKIDRRLHLMNATLEHSIYCFQDCKTNSQSKRFQLHVQVTKVGEWAITDLQSLPPKLSMAMTLCE